MTSDTGPRNFVHRSADLKSEISNVRSGQSAQNIRNAYETLQDAIRTQPFRRFVVHMADGREVPVAHPELIAYKAGTRTAVVVSGDPFEFIDLLLATGLRYQTIEEMPATDGSRGGS